MTQFKFGANNCKPTRIYVFIIITLTISGQGGCAAEGEAAAWLQHPHHRGLPPAGEGAQGRARQVRQGGEQVSILLAIPYMLLK